MFSRFGLKQFVPFAVSALTFASAAFGATAFINQIGYRPADEKDLVLLDANGPVEFVDQSGMTVLTATPSAASYWAPSGQNVQLVDFSELKTAGTYSVKVNGQLLRSDVKIADNTYEEITKAALKWYYYQRASMVLDQTYAGQWARPAGHMSASVSLHSSTGKSGSISSPKGWYDAGDYGRYIVNSGITTYTLLSLYEHYPAYFNTLKWGIPAEGTLPDILAEIKYNLDWMLTMQDTDGGVFHKLTSLGFPGDVMPANDNSALYVIGKGTAATFDFAGVMAAAYRVYKSFDATYAAQCLEAAQRAYVWGIQNPNVTYHNPNGVSTGEYGDDHVSDEKIFAGAELYISTGDPSYKPQLDAKAGVPAWPDVAGLGIYGAATHAAEFGGDATVAIGALSQTGNDFVSRAMTGFGAVMKSEDFVWGSNAVAANQGVWLLHAFYVTGERKYYDAAKKVLDYLLGKNPLDMSFMTGFGTKSPRNPHHRPSTADGVSAPVPGMLVGGPQNNDNGDEYKAGKDNPDDASWKCSAYSKPQPALSYIDNRCSYASNEVAINWNAPLAYLAGAIEALNAGHKPAFAVAGLAGGTDAIRPTSLSRGAVANDKVRLRFENQKIFIEKSGEKFDLKGIKIK